jgi:hypothetical protein
MNNFKHKIATLRRFYSPQRYAANAVEHDALQRIVVEGREKEFIGKIGFSLQSTWSKRCKDPTTFTPVELKIIANFFHLDDLTRPGEAGWQLLTDAYSSEEVTLRLVQHGYGTLRTFRGTLPVAAGDSATLAEFRNPFLAVPAGPLDLAVIEGRASRGAAEQDELEALPLLQLVAPRGPYAYRVAAESKAIGFLYIFELSSDANGGRAAGALIAPSRLHPDADFSSPTLVPQARGASGPGAFVMSDRYPRCTTIAFVTERPLENLPPRAEDKLFAEVSLEVAHLLAAQLARVAASSAVLRGVCMLGLRT